MRKGIRRIEVILLSIARCLGRLGMTKSKHQNYIVKFKKLGVGGCLSVEAVEKGAYN